MWELKPQWKGPFRGYPFRLAAGIGLMALSGCTVGPAYKRPEVKVEPGFSELKQTTSVNPKQQSSQAISEAAPVSDWWRVFGDSELNHLVDEAAARNYTLQIATARVRQARAERLMARADLFPQIGANAGYNRARGSKNLVLPLGPPGASGGGSSSGTGGSSGRTAKTVSADPPADPPGDPQPGATATPLTPFGSGGLPGVTTDLYQLGFDMDWELDIFGGTRRQIQAANAELQAAVESRRDIMVSLLAEVARDYLEMRGTQQRLEVAQETLADERQTLRLTESMYHSGLANELDVTRAAGQVATTASTIPPLEAGVRNLIHALSILLSREPDALSSELSRAKPLPPVPPRVPVGLPSELLRRRPDIRQAERQLAAATALIGSAKADLFPRFFITGSAGLDSTSVSHLLDWQSHYFLISPTVSWPLFQAGRIRANITLQKARRDAAMLQYRGVILLALQEVEDALANYTTQQGRRSALAEAKAQEQQALRFARERYENGLTDFLTVLDAQRSLLATQDTLALSNQTVCTDLVALYKALGGGWAVEEAGSGAK